MLAVPWMASPLAGQADLRLGPEVLVSHQEDGGALRVEPSAAVHDSLVVVAWNDSHGGMRTGRLPGVSIGWAVSADRGESFEFGGYLPRTDESSLLPAADSWLMTDGDGDVYLQLLSWDGDRQEIMLYVMDRRDPGTWTRKPSPIAIDKSRSEPGIDKPAMHVDDAGEVGIAYTVLTEPRSIDYVHSRDGGSTWSEPVRISAPNETRKSGTNVARHGRHVIVAWMEDGSEVWYAESRDEGATFGDARLLHALERSVEPPAGYALGVGPAARIANNPWMATDRPGTFHLIFAEGTDAGGTRILLFRKPAGAEEWSAPSVVGDSPDTVVKVFPSIAVVGSRPAILYYDRRANPGTALTDAWLSIRRPDGTFEDVRLSEVSTDWLETPGDPEHSPIQRNFGDYVTLASDGEVLVATWVDARDGAPRVYARTVRVGD